MPTMVSRRLITVALVLCCVAPLDAAASEKLSLMQRIERLESIVEAQQGQGQPGQGSTAMADLVTRVNELQLEISRLRGELELQAHHIDQLTSGQRDMYMDLDRRLGGRGGAAAEAAAPGQAAPAGQPAGPRYQPAGPTEQPSAPHSEAPGAGYLPPSSGYQTPSSGYQPPAWGYREQEQPSEQSPATEARSPEYQSESNVPDEPSPPPGAAPRYSSVPALPAPERPAAAPSLGTGEPAQEDARYQAAFDLLKSGRYDESAKAFRAFLAEYPRGRWADNAQYWLGETAYVQRDFKTALAEFRKVTEGYPSSPKVPDALLKQGFIDYETQQWADARRMLSQVVQSYPTFDRGPFGATASPGDGSGASLRASPRGGPVRRVPASRHGDLPVPSGRVPQRRDPHRLRAPYRLSAALRLLRHHLCLHRRQLDGAG